MCITCFKRKPRVPETIMADLPKCRVTSFTRPFDVCGVDYAGPLQVRESKRRGNIPITKAYVAVFICLNTKAVHLELVSSLTIEAFMAALRRFIARRGQCSFLYSDNATNFVGAQRELREVYEFIRNNDPEIKERLTSKNIEWKFIPPRAPHFGGLWEAAVKAMKRHLLIITQQLKYTFEEYSTLLAEIEAVLNSRPLTAVSSDPDDFTVLTPSHFLIGIPQTEPLERDYLDVQENHLSRWQHIQKLKQHFWKRWQREYLQQLQGRVKWRSSDDNLKPSTLVLLIEDNTPSFQWPIARVLEVYPGEDGIVRVALIKISSNTYKRPIKKLCPLPIEGI